MADKQNPSSRSSADKKAPPRRNDVIRCENCGEDYAITYKRCPFCDEKPGRAGGIGTGSGPLHGPSHHHLDSGADGRDGR